jgi:hypothetical protein
MNLEVGASTDEFPNQSDSLGKRVEVCFKFDASRTIGGEVVREDIEGPFNTIIKLDDGRYILAGECSYKLTEIDGPDLSTGSF